LLPWVLAGMQRGQRSLPLISIRTVRILSSPSNARQFSVEALPGSRSMSFTGKTIGAILFSETSPLNLKRQAPLFGALQLVHAASQIGYLLIESYHSSTREDAYQRH
jgi:hypothetical protein